MIRSVENLPGEAKPPNVVDVYLQPGEWHFGDRETRIRTVLGSCVSLVFWHPHRRIGGMCHYMLPTRGDARRDALDGRYADEAAILLFEHMRQAGSSPREYQVKLFGGANMFPDRRGGTDHVGFRNIEAARAIMRQHALTPACEHVAGVGHRNLVFESWSGCVWVRHRAPLVPDAAMFPCAEPALRRAA